MMVRCSPPPVIACMRDCSSRTRLTSTPERFGAAPYPGTAVPSTMWVHPAASRAAAHSISRRAIIVSLFPCRQPNRGAGPLALCAGDPIEYGCPVSVFATATGTGSWPGTAARPAAEIVVGELSAAMAHLVELPARGVGADIIGRAGALLIDVAIDTVPRGYRVVARAGAGTRRGGRPPRAGTHALGEAGEAAGLRGGGGAGH